MRSTVTTALLAGVVLVVGLSLLGYAMREERTTDAAPQRIASEAAEAHTSSPMVTQPPEGVDRRRVQDRVLSAPWPAGFSEMFLSDFRRFYSSPDGYGFSLDYEQRMFEAMLQEPSPSWLDQCLSRYSQLKGFIQFNPGLGFRDGLFRGTAEGANIIHLQRIRAVEYLAAQARRDLTRIDDFVRPSDLLAAPLEYPPEFLVWYVRNNITDPLPDSLCARLVILREETLDKYVTIVQQFALIEPSIRAVQSAMGIEFKNEVTAWRSLVPEYDSLFVQLRELNALFCFSLMRLVGESGLIVVNPIP